MITKGGKKERFFNFLTFSSKRHARLRHIYMTALQNIQSSQEAEYAKKESLMDYIDQNPVKAGLSETPYDWKASGAFYKAQGKENKEQGLKVKLVGSS